MNLFNATTLPHLETLVTATYRQGTGKDGLSMLPSVRLLTVLSIVQTATAQTTKIRLPPTVIELHISSDVAARIDLRTCKKVERLCLDFGFDNNRYDESNGHYDKGTDMKWLRLLPNLNRLEVRNPNNADISAIGPLVAMHTLSLNCDCEDAQIGDEAASLTVMPRLESLLLKSCWGVTGTGIRSLANLHNLRRLDLVDHFPKVDDNALKAVCELTQLKELTVHLSERPANELVQCIRGMPQLEGLTIGVAANDNELGS